MTEAATNLSVLELGMGWFPEQAGGLNRVYHELVHNLPAAGVSCVGIITGTDRAASESNGAIRAVVESDAPLSRRWRAIRDAVRSVLAEKHVDLVAAHFAIYAWPALGVIRRTFVFHFHGPWAAESAREGGGRIAPALKALLERRVYRRADRMIVLSEAFKTILCDTYGVDPSRVDIVPGGVDCDRYDSLLSREEARRKLGWPIDRPIVLSIRRLVHRMGLEDLIVAAKSLVESNPDLLIHIAGRGPLLDSLQSMIDEKNLREHVRLIGFVSDADLPLAYRAANLSIVPTVALEGFGLIAIESLAAGTPVIVTPVGGLPEVVRDLSTNLICASAGAASLQKALAKALAEPDSLPDAMTCQRYARENFDSSIMARRTKAVYERALKS
jgi:glycogen synthase